MSETTRSRIVKVLHGERPADRLPIVEWATWWDKTIRRWQGEGLDDSLGYVDIKRHFNLDVDYQCWMPAFAPGAPPMVDDHSWIRNSSDYDALRPFLFPKVVPFDRELWKQRARDQQEGKAAIWFTLDGFFWFPRVLFGIEPHLYAFVDEPELMHRINSDLVDYMRRVIEQFSEVCQPDFMTFAEDMSYNHGPMLSKEMFDEFMAPYYHQIIPELTSRGITPIIDSDGQVEPMIPWFKEVGIQGILPLERMAGVDVARIRENHPEWIMIGAFDKTVMHKGREAIRAEFERLLPVMRTGRFIPSVDHQTPPEVSISDYRIYLELLIEYAEKGASS
jgi:hypothetical protein